jgi:quinol monooxygenase YgiN
MAVFKLARFEVRPEARDAAERAMHEFASYVRAELADSMWTTYRDKQHPTRYVSYIRADTPAADERHRTAPGTQAFVAALYPLLVAPPEFTDFELVTSSDLAPRHKRDQRPNTKPRRR